MISSPILSVMMRMYYNTLSILESGISPTTTGIEGNVLQYVLINTEVMVFTNTDFITFLLRMYYNTYT